MTTYKKPRQRELLDFLDLFPSRNLGWIREGIECTAAMPKEGDAHYWKAMSYLFGIGHKRNPKKAHFELWKSLRTEGSREECLALLAWQYTTGYGAKIDMEKAKFCAYQSGILRIRYMLSPFGVHSTSLPSKLPIRFPCSPKSIFELNPLWILRLNTYMLKN